jgi:HK97 family phage prohead protease
MSVRSSNVPLEVTMTHRVGAGGQTERCERPPHVLEMAQRMRRWASSAETCQSCQSLPAVSVRAAMPLCSRCRENRSLRYGLRPDTLGLTPRAIRQEDAASDGPQFRGLAIVFNSRSVELWGFTEEIKPAAADRNETEQIDVRALWSHNPDITIGRISAGTLRARKVTRGVSIEIDPPTWAAPHVETVRRRDVTGMSFAFQALEDEWHLEDGEPVRDVIDMRYFEVSGVAFPAYPATTLTVANAGDRSAWWHEQRTAERLRLAR